MLYIDSNHGEGVSVENRTLIENPRFLSFIDTIIIAHCSEIYSSRLNIRVAVSKRLQPFCSDMKGNLVERLSELRFSFFSKKIIVQECQYTGSLAPADFSDAVFARVHFPVGSGCWAQVCPCSEGVVIIF